MENTGFHAVVDYCGVKAPHPRRSTRTWGGGSPSDYYRLPKMQKELSGMVDVMAAVDHILEDHK